MATSSITKNFVISGEKQVEKFVSALEASANSVTSTIEVAVAQLHDPEEIKQFLSKRKRKNA